METPLGVRACTLPGGSSLPRFVGAHARASPSPMCRTTTPRSLGRSFPISPARCHLLLQRSSLPMYPVRTVLGRSPYSPLPFLFARPLFSVFPPTQNLSPTPFPPCPGSPFLPRKLAPAPPPISLSFALVPAARPLSPVVGGEGSGGWHPVRRCARQVKGGGAGARVSRSYERIPAFNPASGLVPNPALSAGHPGGHPRTLDLRNFARWSARTRTRFSAPTSFWSTWTRTTSLEKSWLVRADQAALF